MAYYENLCHRPSPALPPTPSLGEAISTAAPVGLALISLLSLFASVGISKTSPLSTSPYFRPKSRIGTS